MINTGKATVQPKGFECVEDMCSHPFSIKKGTKGTIKKTEFGFAVAFQTEVLFDYNLFLKPDIQKYFKVIE